MTKPKHNIADQGHALRQTERRLSQAPRPEMRRQAVDQIQRRILASHQQQHQLRKSHASSRWMVTQFVAAAAVTAFITFGVLPTLLQRVNSPNQHTTIETLPTLMPFSTQVPEGGNAAATVQPIILPNLPADLPYVATPTPEVSLLTIQGPVEAMTDDSVTIWGMEIEVEPSDPLFDLVQVGDVLRVEANPQPEGEQIVMLADTVRFVEVDAYVNAAGDEAWRDNGRCDNPPPAWALAYGWHRRCDGAVGGPGNSAGQGNSGNHGNAQGNSNGNAGGQGNNGNAQGQGNSSNGNAGGQGSGGNNGNPPSQSGENNGNNGEQGTQGNNGNAQNEEGRGKPR